MLRIGLETSIARFVQTGLGVYATNIYQHLQSFYPEIEVVPCAIPFQLPQPVSPGVQKLFAAYWQIIHARLILPLRASQLRCDLIHYTMTMPIPARMPCPIVATVHDLIPFLYPEWAPPLRGYRLRRGVRLAIQRSQHIITDSTATKQDVMTYFGLPNERVTTVLLGQGIPLPNIDPIDAAQSIAAHYHLEPGYVLCVGSLEPRKNIEQVIEAYALLRRHRPQMPRLVVVGGGTWRHNRLRELATKLQLEQQIVFTGHVPTIHLSALFRCAGVFVYPSLYEGFGFPPLEAMACNCPVVTSNTTSLPEVVGNAALLIDPQDVYALATGIEQVLFDADLAQELRSRGQVRVQQFSWRRCAEETVAVYRRVLHH